MLVAIVQFIVDWMVSQHSWIFQSYYSRLPGLISLALVQRNPSLGVYVEKSR